MVSPTPKPKPKSYFLSKKQLNGMKNHKYSCQNNSIIEPYLNEYYWRHLVNLLPLWVAPNLITITGLMLNAFSAILLFLAFPKAKVVQVEAVAGDSSAFATFSQRLSEQASNIFILNAITLFAYQTLDALDGKQARRTGSSSPLGELFDHGMDSISMVLVTLSSMIAVNHGAEPIYMLVMTCVALTGYYIGHWSTYLTGTLTLGMVDVSESQLMVIGFYLVSAKFGPEVFDTYNTRHFIILILLGILTRLVLDCINKQLFHGIGHKGRTSANTNVLSPGLPLFLFYFSVYLMYQSDTSVMVENPVVFTLLYGICFSKITNKLIIAHMSKTGLEVFDRIFLGPVFYIILSKFVLSQELSLWARGYLLGIRNGFERVRTMTFLV